MSVISKQRVRELIVEEMHRLNEDIDHEGIGNVVSAAGKLLGAVKKFRDDATGQMTHAVTPHLEQLQRVLEDMVQTPGSYVKVVAPKKKIVSLRAVHGGDK
jgi:hypothetical protein